MVITENGILDKYGIIDSMINNLNNVTVSGYNNLLIIVDALQKLKALKDGLMDEEKHRMKKESEEHGDEISQDR